MRRRQCLPDLVDAEDDDDSDHYYSLDEEGDVSETSDVEASGACANQETEDAERRRVLQAAGVIINDSQRNEGAQNIPTYTDSVSGGSNEVSWAMGTRELSGRSSIGVATEPPLSKRNGAQLLDKELPPVPTIDLPDDETTSAYIADNTALFDSGMPGIHHRPQHSKTSDVSSAPCVDDAFERYNSYKRRHGVLSANRMSASSFDMASLAISSPPRSPVISLTPSLREREQDQGGESRTSHFFSFLGRYTRSSTPDTQRERKITVISAPIHTSLSSSGGTVPGASHGQTGEGSPVFGTSWASLLDRSALEGIPKVERKRQEAIFELISTEADYVRDLQLVVELFYSRLTNTLGEALTSVIFCNIEDILLTNTTFLSALEERQRDSRLYIDSIGDLLEAHMPNMRVYLDYCANQATAGKVLQSRRNSNPDLAAILQRLREDPTARNLDLSSYLLAPMQRLTRYPLLVKQILQYTDPPTILRDSIETTPSPQAELMLPFKPEHAERTAIASALSCAERILEEVNETIRERESWERLSEVSKELRIGKDRLDLTLPTRHLGPRKLLKEGVLAKAKSGRKLRVLLCSDILLLLNESGGGLYRVPIPVHELEIYPSRGRSRDNDASVHIHRTRQRGGETLVLRASSGREARAWVEAIVQAAAKAKEGIMATDGIHDLGLGMEHGATGGICQSVDDTGDRSSGVTTSSGGVLV